MSKEDLVYCGKVMGMCAVAGIVAGLGLSFTALSPLVVGGIAGSALPASMTVFYVGDLLYQFCKGNEIQDDDKNTLRLFGIATAISAVVGVGIVVAMESPVLTCGIIGAIASIVGSLAANKVNEHIIEPAVKKVTEYFSSKESQPDM